MIKKSIIYLFNALLLNKHMIWLFNLIYENSSVRLCNYFEFMANKPQFDFTWKVHIEKNRLLIPVKKDDLYNAFHLPLSYKRNDPSIREIEKLVNNHNPDKDLLFVDIGANFGLRSFYFASKNRNCLLFEPNDALKPITERIIDTNKLNNVRLINMAISDHNDKQVFFISQSSYLSSLDKKHAEEDNIIQEKEVELTSLDYYLNQNYKNTPVAYIKFDVEGHEKKACLGSIETIKKYKPTLLIEMIEYDPEITSFLDVEGYKSFGIYFFEQKLKLISTKNIAYNKEKIIDYLFIHDDKLLETFAKYEIKN